MTRVLSFASSFFFSVFVVLLVLGLTSLDIGVVADEPLSVTKSDCLNDDFCDSDLCGGQTPCCCECIDPNDWDISYCWCIGGGCPPSPDECQAGP